jgi:hypothetical protein
LFHGGVTSRAASSRSHPHPAAQLQDQRHPSPEAPT